MKKLLKSYLETAYDSPLEIEIDENYKGVFVYCNNDCIARGDIFESKNFKGISWTIPIGTWNKMIGYIPTIEPNMYKDIISWMKKKCKKQGIPMVGVSGFNLK